jgi:hypothetical protein
LSGNTIFSGATNLNDIFERITDFTSYSANTNNTITGNTSNISNNTSNILTLSATVISNTSNIFNKYDKSGGTITGNVIVTGTTNIQNSFTATTISSGSTDLNNIFERQSDFILYSGNTNNTITGNTTNITSLQNSKYDKSGGTISGNVVVTGNTNVQGNLSGNSIFSGSTDLNSIFERISDFNIYSGNTNSILNNKADKSGTTFTGNVIAPSLSGTTIYGNTILSGSTDLNTIFERQSDFNTYTGNTNTIIISKFDKSGGTISGNIIITGTTNVQALTATTISSGSTDLNNIFERISDFNIYTGSTNATINNKYDKSGGTISGNIIVTGTTNLQGLTGTTIYGTTILSGGTDLNSIFERQSDFNIYTGNTNNTLTNISGNVTSLSASVTTNISNISNLQNNKYDKSGGTISGNVIVTGNTNIQGSLTATTIFSGNTDLNSIFERISDFNIYTGSTNTIVNNKFDKSGGTISGNVIVTGNTNLQSLSATTIYSGSTDLNTIFERQSDFNTYTGNTNTTLNNKFDITGGTITGNTNIQGNLSGGTIFSGSTNLNSVFERISDFISYSANTLNTITGNTASITSLQTGKADKSGTTFTGNVVAPSLSGTSITGTTIYGNSILSGSTDLNNIFERQSDFIIYSAATISLITGNTVTINNKYDISGGTITGNVVVTGNLTLTGLTSGSVIYVGTNGLFSQNNNNFYFANGLLNVGTAGDQTGTDPFNIYNNADAYAPNSANTPGTAASAAWTVSTSRGTGVAATESLDGDFIGSFSGWGYNGTTYVPQASIRTYVKGTTATNRGGQLEIWTKADGGVMTQAVVINNLQKITVGAWNATIIGPTYGGTGINNGAKTITLDGNLVTTGAFNLTLAVPQSTTYTLPNTANETLAGLNTVQTFSVINTFSSPIRLADGTSASPGLSFASQTGTGLHVASGVMGFDLAGTTIFNIKNTGLTLNPANPLIQIGDSSGTDIAGANFTLQSGIGTGAGVESYVKFQTPTQGTTGAVAQTLVTRMQVGAYPGGGAATNSLWLSNVAVATNNYNLSYSSSSLLINHTSQLQFRINNSLFATIGGASSNISTGGSNSSIYRLTNVGSNVTAHMLIDPANTTSTAGALGYAFSTADGMSYTHANGTLRIRGWSVILANLGNTAGSEYSDIQWTPQNTTDTFILNGGNFKMTNFAGTTNRFVTVDINGNFQAVHDIIAGQITNNTIQGYLTTGTNWSLTGTYSGTALTLTYQTQWYNDSNYFYFLVADNQPIRIPSFARYKLLDSSVTTTGTPASTVETDLFNTSVAASSLANNTELLDGTAAGTFAANTNQKQVRAYFGGTLIFDSGALAFNSGNWTLEWDIIRESATVVRCNIRFTTSTTVLAAYAQYTRITGLTLSNANTFKITGTGQVAVAAVNDITGNMYKLSWQSATN